MKTIIANWKANPSTLDEAQEIFGVEIAAAAKYENVQTVICPPFIFLEELAKMVYFHDHNQPANVLLGAQDIFWDKSGPYTGEVTAEMLKHFSVSHVLIGHSERRYLLGEGDAMVNKKIKAALATDIIPVVLVGEKESTDDRSAILTQQLTQGLQGLDQTQLAKILLVYEPVWAISTQVGAHPDNPDNTRQAIALIKELMAKNFGLTDTTCLYGGSINEGNVEDFLKYPEIAGAVVGGASLRKEEFSSILKLVSELASENL